MKHPKARVLGIAPYEGMKTAMERAAESYPDLWLEVYTGDLEQGVDIVRNAPPDRYDCIISRGGTAEMIRSVTTTPVVEIALSVYDVLRAIKLAENYSKLYAIVGYPSITEPAHTLCDLLRYELDILTVHSPEEVHTTLARLRQGGYRMVVSDMVTHTIAREMGLDAFLITSGAESLHSALQQALRLSADYRRLRHENQFLRTALQDEAALAVLDADGALRYAVPAEPPEALLAALQSRAARITPGAPQKFYHNEGRALYQISAQPLRLGDGETCTLFRYAETQIPLHAHKAGLRYFDQSECEHLFRSSFYSLSGAMGELESTVRAMAATRQPVMIAGETGTGKEQIARALYLQSSLRSRPFAVVNCRLVNDKVWAFLMNHYNSPLGSTGYTVYFQNFEALDPERGAELGALIRDTGLLRRVRLLFSCRSDEDAPLPNLGQEFVNRLGCLTLHLPSLRTRSDEIPSLASLYLDSLNMELGKQISGFDPHAIEQLQQYDWPGNYTQFKQVLYELATLANSAYIRSSAVAEVLSRQRALLRTAPVVPVSDAPARTLDVILRDAIQQALAANGGNQTAAARQLGISRTTLWRHLNG